MNWLKRLFKPAEPKKYELIRTYKQKIKDCYIGSYKQDLEVIGFLYKVSQGGYSWCETEISLPTFKPFWDHEYALIDVLDTTGKQMEARMREDYLRENGNTEYRF